MRSALASVLIWVPTASGATIWLGHTKESVICPGVGASVYHDDFTLAMEPGSGWGTLTFVGGDPIDVVTDWTVDGKWGYFSASFQEPNGGPFILYGWISGKKMKGYVGGHIYGNGCVIMGKLRGWQ
jgi:hypothetical protein